MYCPRFSDVRESVLWLSWRGSDRTPMRRIAWNPQIRQSIADATIGLEREKKKKKGREKRYDPALILGDPRSPSFFLMHSSVLEHITPFGFFFSFFFFFFFLFFKYTHIKKCGREFLEGGKSILKVHLQSTLLWSWFQTTVSPTTILAAA